MCLKHIDGKGYNRDTDLAEIEFLMFFRFPYLRSERLQMKNVSESDTFSLSAVVFRSIVKAIKFQLYIIIKKPLIEAAGGMILPAICYAQRGGMLFLGDYHYSKEHWQSNR